MCVCVQADTGTVIMCTVLLFQIHRRGDSGYEFAPKYVWPNMNEPKLWFGSRLLTSVVDDTCNILRKLDWSLRKSKAEVGVYANEVSYINVYIYMALG